MPNSNQPSKLLRPLVWAFLACSMISCAIMINENDYRILNYAERQKVKSFDQVAINQKVNNEDSVFLYEINPEDIKNTVKEQAYTWVHIWRPYCPNDLCQNIGYFSAVVEEREADQLELLMVSVNYDFKEINKIASNSSFDRPIYVLQDSYFGHKMDGNSKKLLLELDPEASPDRKTGVEDYFFKGSELIFSGNNLDAAQIDSLLRM